MSGQNSKAGQLGLLLWKNGILQMKKKLLSVVEVGLPVLFAVLLYVIRVNIHPKDMPPTHWEAFTVDQIPWTDANTSHILLYTPNNTLMNRLMVVVAGRLNTENHGVYCI